MRLHRLHDPAANPRSARHTLGRGYRSLVGLAAATLVLAACGDDGGAVGAEDEGGAGEAW